MEGKGIGDWMAKRMRTGLVYLVTIALLVSIAWLYLGLKDKPKDISEMEASLEISSDYRIVSRKDLRIWPAGTELEAGLAAYFYASDPLVYVSPRIKISGLGSGKLEGSITSRVLLRSINDKSEVYWSYPLYTSKEQKFEFEKGIENTNHNFFQAEELQLELAKSYELLQTINDELMFYNGIYQIAILSDIRVQGRVNGISLDKTLNHTIPIRLGPVDFAIAEADEHMLQVPIVQNTGDLRSGNSIQNKLSSNLMPLIVVIFLSGLLFYLIYDRKELKSKKAREHRRFKEWITEGRVELKDQLSINILSLEGLVDLAIDLDKRVIYDSRRSRYYVLTEDLVYVYDAENIQNILDNKQQLGKLLLEQGLITNEQLEMGLYYQKKIGRKLGESLIALGILDETTLYSTLAAQNNIDYYELDTKMEIPDKDWMEVLSIKQAKVMNLLPLGKREDRLVVACGEPSLDGIKKTLEEIFNQKIEVVLTRPSVIYDILERLDQTYIGPAHPRKESGLNQIKKEEKEEFLSNYYRGKILYGLFLRASGIVNSSLLENMKENEISLQSLTDAGIIQGELLNLLKGLDKAVKDLEWKERQERMTPDILHLLQRGNYLRKETIDWIKREIVLQQLPLDEFLVKKILVSPDTLNKTQILLDTLKEILRNHA